MKGSRVYSLPGCNRSPEETRGVQGKPTPDIQKERAGRVEKGEDDRGEINRES